MTEHPRPLTLDDVRAMVREQAREHATSPRFSGMVQWCRAHGVNRAHAHGFLHGDRRPYKDLLDALGLEWCIVPKCDHPGVQGAADTRSTADKLKEAIALLDEVNRRKTSRITYGIGPTLHAKLRIIRATLARAVIDRKARPLSDTNPRQSRT